MAIVIIIPIQQIRKLRPGALRELAQPAGLCGVKTGSDAGSEALGSWVEGGRASPLWYVCVLACVRE